MKKVLVLILAACMLLCGCAKDGEKDTPDTTVNATGSVEADADNETESTDAGSVDVGSVDATMYENNIEFYSAHLGYGIVSFYLPEDSIWVEGFPLDEMECSLWTESYSSMISLGIAEFSPADADKTERVAASYGGSEYTLTEIEHEVFTHHLISEGPEGYYEVYLNYEKENPVSGGKSYFGVEVYIDLTVDGADKDALVADFHTVVDSLDITLITEQEYNDYFGY